MGVPYKPFVRKTPMLPMTDERLAEVSVKETSLLLHHPDVVHRFADRMEQGLCHSRPCIHMTDEEFIQHVKAGDFDV